MLVAAPFGKSPQLAAIAATFLAILLAIIALVVKGGLGLSLIYTLVFPPGFFVFVILGLSAYEQDSKVPNISVPDPEYGNRVGALLFVAFIVVFIYPVFAYWVENAKYNAKNPGEGLFARFRKKVEKPAHPEDAAIAVRNLKKTFPSPKLFSRQRMTAIEDLSFTVPKTGIWILLGANGAGKSTVLSMIGNLLGRDSGSITFEGGAAHPPRGSLGIVPQKNVFIPELSCYQTVRLWSAIKRPTGTSESRRDLKQLLIDCDLESKIHEKSGSLSGGQKRKLQLAIGLVGGSKILLVDEATSGVDPLSRRALWRALTAVKHERTILFTTHFLDEADLLGDNVTVLAAPGRILAEGTPVSLKSSLGEGYTIVVTFPTGSEPEKERHSSIAQNLLSKIIPRAENCRCTHVTPTGATFSLRSKDVHVVREVLDVFETEKAAGTISSYEVHGTSLEDIFIGLMGRSTQDSDGHIVEDAAGKEGEGTVVAPVESDSRQTPTTEAEDPKPLVLSNGRRTWFYQQAWTVYRKRLLILRRAWLGPLLAMAIACSGACIPLFFMKDRVKTCEPDFVPSYTQSLMLPWSSATNYQGFGNFSTSSSISSYMNAYTAIIAPPDALAPLSGFFTSVRVNTVVDRQALLDNIQANAKNISFGGIFINPAANDSLVTFEVS
ncbi:hypothetical protein FRC17_007080, partial [Serendipita sp. 399]